MQRNEWKFDFSAADLAKAANAKLSHHQGRLEFWQSAKNKTMAEIKDKGISVADTQSDVNSNRSRGYGAQIVVDAVFQRQLNEAEAKINEHLSRVRDYEGWAQVLSANANRTYSLHADDYLFFFGK